MRQCQGAIAAVLLVGCGSVSTLPKDADTDATVVDARDEADAAVDGPSIDAARSAWVGPQPVLNVNTSASSEFQPTISGDRLELYFVRNSGGTDQGRLFVATRSSATAPWGLPTEVTVAAGHLHPELSSDGLELYTTFSPNTMRAVRATRSAPWSTPQVAFPGISAATTGDGLKIYYIKVADGRVHLRRRASRNDTWGAEETPLTTDGIYNAVSVNPEDRYMLLNGASDPFSFPESASMVRVGDVEDWTSFIEEQAVGMAKAQACDFVDDTEIYCSIVDATNRHDIVRFTRM